MTKKLILASSSQTRFDLLSRFKLDFETLNPDIDESRIPSESAESMASRLATEKALVVLKKVQDNPVTVATQGIIIASDELLVNVSKNDDLILGKPMNKTSALEQLMNASGCLLRFYTSLCVLDYDGLNKAEQFDFLCKTDVQFRDFSKKEALRVIEHDNILKCAGSFRSEGLSITLCQSITEDEPGSLMGLPLISLAQILLKRGVL